MNFATRDDAAPSPEDDVTDQELVQRMLRRENRAWRLFSRRYDRLILATIRRITVRFSRSSSADADEIHATLMSSLLARDMVKLRTFDAERSRLSNWIALLASHATWDHLRQAQRRSLLMRAMTADLEPEPGHDPARIAISREDFQRVMALREELTARERQFFDMMYLQGVSVKEAASQLGISVKTVYTKDHKVRVKLALGLTGEDG